MLIKNRYEPKELIGDGGMGKVYRAIDSFGQREVAIKVIQLNNKSGEMLLRLKREFQFLSEINHPNIIRAYDFIPNKDQIYMVIEYIKGLSLQEFITRYRKRLSFHDQLALCLQISRAVDVINTTGIVHRDIKPSNIMISKDSGFIKVLDLGASKRINSDKDTAKITKEGSVIGSPAYMSPEQIKSKTYETSDVFSMSVTIYQFFLWRENSPFERKNILATLNSIANEKIPLLSEIIQFAMPEEQKVCTELAILLDLGLAKNPEERIDSKSFVEKLSQIYEEYCMMRMQASGVHGQTWSPGEGLTPQKRQELAALGQKYGTDDEVIRRKKIEERRTQRMEKQQKRQSEKNKIVIKIIGVAMAALIIYILW